MICFRKFDQADWAAFSGCEAKEPMIAEFGETFILIVADQLLELIDNQETSVESRSLQLRAGINAQEFAQALVNAYEVLDYTLWCTLINGTFEESQNLG